MLYVAAVLVVFVLYSVFVYLCFCIYLHSFAGFIIRICAVQPALL
jgi:hypothetical protein